MKRTFISLMLALAVVTGVSAQSWKDLLGKVAGDVVNEVASTQGGSAVTDILGTLLGNSLTLSPEALEGTWSYEGVACVLESENALSDIGGTLVTGQIESKLDEKLNQIGLKPGSCSFAFTKDGACAILVGGYNIQGTYVLDAQEKVINFSFLYGNVNIKTYVAYEVQKLNIVFRADKLLAFVKGITSFLSNNATAQQVQQLAAVSQAAGAAGSLLNAYDGMMLGAKFTKEQSSSTPLSTIFGNSSASNASNASSTVKNTANTTTTSTSSNTADNTANNALNSVVGGLVNSLVNSSAPASTEKEVESNAAETNSAASSLLKGLFK